MSEYLPLLLVAMLMYQQFFFMRHIQRLVDKVMSRDYRDYVTTQEPPVVQRSAANDQGAPEDLGVLQGFGI